LPDLTPDKVSARIATRTCAHVRVSRPLRASRARTRGTHETRNETKRKTFAERLDRACKRDRVMNALVLGDALPTTANRLKLFERCRYWCFDPAETAAIFEALEARDLT